jgi:molecular chaperone DnaK (HSP70)
MPRIELKFMIDANGILHVSAREQRSGKQAEVEVKPTYGLTDEQVENMILESFDKAEDDFRARRLIEARNEANTILSALEKGTNSAAWQQLRALERQNIGTAERELRRVMEGDNYKHIRESIERLNQATMHLAELMMESAVGSALQGKEMEQAAAELGEGPEAPHPIAPAEIK